MKKKALFRLLAFLLVASVACSACSSSVNMHRHNRSNCDCPSF